MCINTTPYLFFYYLWQKLENMDKKQKIDWGDSCILVARVSTPEQVLEEGASPQISDLRNYAKDLGFKNFKEINTVESGFVRTDDKVGWNLVTDFIDKFPQYKTIIITEMSRLSRKKEILFYIQDYLQNHKIQLIIKDMNGFSLFDDYGDIDLGHDIIFSLYASLASVEMAQKKERFERANREYKKKGYSIGGKKLFGYEREADPYFKGKNKYVIDKSKAEQIRQVYRWYAFGIDDDLSKTSISNIVLKCKSIGFDVYLHSKRNVNKLLKEEAYTGYKVTANLRKNPEYFNYKNKSADKYIESKQYECTYPQIIDKPLFDIVQDRLKETSTHTDSISKLDKSSKHVTILAKLIKCRYCNNFFIADYGVRKGVIKFSYRCGGTKYKKELRKCEHSQYMSLRTLDSAIWTFIKEKVERILQEQNESKSTAKINELKNEISNLKESVEDTEKKYDVEERIFRMKCSISHNIDEAYKEYEKKCKEINKEVSKINKAIEYKVHTVSMLEKALDKKDNIVSNLENNISSIEGDKQSIYDYIHLLIKEIQPLYNDNKMTILKVISLSNMEEALNFENEGIPQVKSEKNDGVFFILIAKSTTHEFKMRIIDDALVKWNNDNDNGHFEADGISFSFEDIFSIDIANPIGKPLALSIIEPKITYLDCYESDMPIKNQEKPRELVAARVE